MIYLMRHGLDDENYIGGWSDVDLLDVGKKQVQNTVEEMIENNIKINKIISSDVLRAKTTSKIVQEKYPNAKIEYNLIFREQNKGLLNGMSKEKAIQEYPQYFEKVLIDTIYPNGESLKKLYDRIKENLDYIISLEDNTLIITHRGVINMLYYILNEIPLDMDKKRFGVDHASLHELDKKKQMIRKVF